MAVPSAEPTAPFDAHGGVPTVSFVSSGRERRSGFSEELRGLLRSRLILIHLLALVLGVLIVAISFHSILRTAEPKPPHSYWWRIAVPLAECLIGAVVLW